MTKTQAETLKMAYCTYRDYGHKLVLQEEKAIINEAEVAELSKQVERIWHDLMEQNRCIKLAMYGGCLINNTRFIISYNASY